jgi:hypothetical protein
MIDVTDGVNSTLYLERVVMELDELNDDRRVSDDDETRIRETRVRG